MEEINDNKFYRSFKNLKREKKRLLKIIEEQRELINKLKESKIENDWICIN
jgi:hypothetical protein